MASNNLPSSNNEQYDPNLDAQDEDVLSGGNNRLTYILVGVIVALVLAYIALPKGSGGGIASATPSFMLSDAAVTATVPTSADSIAAGLKAAPGASKEEEEEDDATTTKSKNTSTKTAATATAATAGTAAPVAAAAEAPAVAETAPAPVAEAAPAPAAPTNVTLSGKIEDENGRPLVGATVILRGSNKGASTDASGNYTIEVPAGTENSLVYGYGGYDDEVVRTRGNQAVNVTLTPRAKAGRKRR